MANIDEQESTRLDLSPIEVELIRSVLQSMSWRSFVTKLIELKWITTNIDLYQNGYNCLSNWTPNTECKNLYSKMECLGFNLKNIWF